MFDCQNSLELAEKILQIISNEEFRISALTENRKLIEARADRDKNMMELENCYYNMISP